MIVSVLSLASVVPWLSSMATVTVNTPPPACTACPVAGCAVNTSFGAPSVGTCNETPAAVFHSPPLSDPLPMKKATIDPATRQATTTGTTIRRARFFISTTASLPV